ncbi:MAG: response regulator [Campylobacterales bacterium]|nr:response regulator [Campylobacterales bacterium]
MLKVLVVDDSILMINNIKAYVESLGHSVVGEALNGTDAVKLCLELKPDLITMDITMPDMDGISAIKKIKEFDKEVNIIVLTSHSQEEIVMNSLKVGAKGYILKPVSKENLKDAISNIYDEYSEDDEHLLDY